jgi:TolB-like protein
MDRMQSVTQDSTHAVAVPAGAGWAAGSLAALVVGMAWWLLGGGGEPGPVSLSVPSLVLIATVFLVTGRRSLRGTTRASSASVTVPDSSLAVLPFIDWGTGEDRAFFGRALADEVRARLVTHTGARVAAGDPTGDALAPPGSARRIGRALGVSTVLEGSVLRAGDRSRVTAQLVETQTGFRIWSGTYALRHQAGVEEVARLIVSRMLASAACRRRLSATAPSADRTRPSEAAD